MVIYWGDLYGGREYGGKMREGSGIQRFRDSRNTSSRRRAVARSFSEQALRRASSSS